MYGGRSASVGFTCCVEELPSDDRGCYNSSDAYEARNPDATKNVVVVCTAKSNVFDGPDPPAAHDRVVISRTGSVVSLCSSFFLDKKTKRAKPKFQRLSNNCYSSSDAQRQYLNPYHSSVLQVVVGAAGRKRWVIKRLGTMC